MINVDHKDEKLLKCINEVAEMLRLEMYVLRFWEKEFSQLKPQRHKGKRYYTPDDIKLIMKIKELLYKKKYTIKGVQKVLETGEDPICEKLEQVVDLLNELLDIVNNE